MCADAGVKADALDDLLGVKALHLGIGVQLIEEGDAERQICVCKQFDGLCLCEAHEEGLDIFLDGPLLQQMGEGVGRLHKAVVLHIRTHDDAAGVEIVIQRFGLPQKLRAEDDVPALIFFPDRSREAHRDGGLDDHDGLGIHLHHQLDDRLHRRGIEEVLPTVVVGRGGNDHEVRVPVGRFPVQRSGQVEILFRKVSFNVVILNGGLFVVDLLHLLRHDVHSGDMVVLAQQGGDGQADIACACNGNVQFFECSHGFRSYDTTIKCSTASVLLYHEAGRTASKDKQKHPSLCGDPQKKGCRTHLLASVLFSTPPQALLSAEL